jgi:putative ABC transport system ATP-binding protein
MNNFFKIKNKEIDKHFNFLLKKYDLKYLYNKYWLSSIVSSLIKENVFWTMLFLNKRLDKHPEMVKKYLYIILFLYVLIIPFNKIYYYYKCEFLKNIIDANSKYYNTLLNNIYKKELLNFNFSIFFDILLSLKTDFEKYILTLKHEIDIPIKTLTLFVYSICNQNISFVMIIMTFVFLYISNKLQIKNNLNINNLIKQNQKEEEILKKYMSNSKMFLINNELNNFHVDNCFNKLKENIGTIEIINTNTDIKVSILIYIVVVIIIFDRTKNMKITDFLVNIYIIYDIEYITFSINEYHNGVQKYVEFESKLSILNKMLNLNQESKEEDLETLLKEYKNNEISINKIDEISINKIKNKTPYVDIDYNISIKKGEHVLVDGISGSGKTSLLFILKGIIKPDEIDISPPLKTINDLSYINLTTNKSLYSGNLYDIITNYEESEKVNLDLIDFSIKNSKLEHIIDYKQNRFINIEELSAGEQVRLLLARNIYTIKKKDKYDVLLFDEIDDNLNDQLALEICKNIRQVFKDKIILYITHKQLVKNEFERKIIM